MSPVSFLYFLVGFLLPSHVVLLYMYSTIPYNRAYTLISYYESKKGVIVHMCKKYSVDTCRLIDIIAGNMD